MRRPTFPLPGARQFIVPLTLAAAMAFAACSGGSSDKTTATSASVSQSTTTVAAAGTTAATTAASTTAPSTATSGTVATTTAAPSAATTAATTAATAAATSAATAVATTSTSSSGGSVVSSAFEKEVADAWTNVKSYKATLNEYESGSTTPDLTGTIETVLPDTTHTIFTISGQTIESINVGGKSYFKLAGVWQESPEAATDIATPVSGGDIVSSLTTPTSSDDTITKTGEDTVDGVATDVYQEKSDDGTTITIWIGQKDHLPRKAVTQSGDTRTEITFSDYNTDFGIKAPI